MKHLLLPFLSLLLICTDAYAASDEQRGIYFDKKMYTPSKLPSFEEARDALPSPIPLLCEAERQITEYLNGTRRQMNFACGLDIKRHLLLLEKGDSFMVKSL